MSAITKTIAADIEKAIENLRGPETVEIWTVYVNEHNVPVKRRVRRCRMILGDEVVDGAALLDAS